MHDEQRAKSPIDRSRQPPQVRESARMTRDGKVRAEVAKSCTVRCEQSAVVPVDDVSMMSASTCEPSWPLMFMCGDMAVLASVVCCAHHEQFECFVPHHFLSASTKPSPLFDIVVGTPSSMQARRMKDITPLSRSHVLASIVARISHLATSSHLSHAEFRRPHTPDHLILLGPVPRRPLPA